MKLISVGIIQQIMYLLHEGEKMSAITVIYHFNQEPLAIEHCNGMMKSLK